MIAAGKSTFLKILSGMGSDYGVVSEPLTKWLDVQGTDENNGDGGSGEVSDVHRYLIKRPHP